MDEKLLKYLGNRTDLLKKQYDGLVTAKIRSKYTQDEENAILRKKLANIDFNNEFDEYNDFVEQCKIQAKEELELE